MNSNLEVVVKRENGRWVIREFGYPGSPGIKVDALVVSAANHGDDFVQGRIVAIHGLDQEIASQLNLAQLKSLGVGSQAGRGRHAWGRTNLHLGADGKITKGQ